MENLIPKEQFLRILRDIEIVFMFGIFFMMQLKNYENGKIKKNKFLAVKQ